VSAVTELVVGTAGHIDHGKTSLVKALTSGRPGVDPGARLDRLPEEKKRGITITLGFTHQDLPDGRRVGWIDVPGHERLVRTMVAGAGGIDAVVLCVSASEGAMPQTREHLAILDLLGVRAGCVVLTMCDLVDDEMIELATEDVRDTVRGTFLEGAPIVPCSAVTGAGLEALVAVLSTFTRAERGRQGVFRMPVDRGFVRPGFGTVVTGTVWSGALTDGSLVTLYPDGESARVRGIHVHGAAVSEVRAGFRAAINLAGIERDEVPRGTVVAGGALPCPHVIDVTYRHLAGSAPIEDGAPVRALLGTGEALGYLHVAADLEEVEPGTTVSGQLRLDAPLPCLPGDRFVLRRPSPEETLGGGVVVDPWAPRMRKRDRVEVGDAITRLAGGDVAVWLERAGPAGFAPAEWADRLAVRPAGSGDPGVMVGDRVLGAALVARLEALMLAALSAYHLEHPLVPGANRRELKGGMLAAVTDKVRDGVIERLVLADQVVVSGPLVRRADFAVRLTSAQEAAQGAILAAIVESGLVGMTTKAVVERAATPDAVALVHLLEGAGKVVELSGIGWVVPSAVDGVAAALDLHFAAQSVLTTADLKELFGLSRKTAIPLLEWLDRRRWTRRVGDERVLGDQLPRSG
jgi:selenocysteine-specific elongation factor